MFTLLGAAQVVPMGEDEHYAIGVALRSYPCGPAHAWDGWNHVGADGETQKIISGALTNPAFRGFAAYMVEQCNTRGTGGAQFADRVAQTFPAVEAYAVEREFWSGHLLGAGQPSLAGAIPVGGPDITIFPHASTAVSAVEGVAALEAAIATTGRAGIIHTTPAAVTKIAATGGLLSKVNSNPPTLQTINGTTVVPGYGYQEVAGVISGSTPVPPAGHTAPTGTQEWMIATGQVEVRRSANIEITPDPTDDALWQTIDRPNNLITYEAIRYYVVDWDACFKAAVLIDRAI
jgi:hypothetical protein